MFSRNPVGHIDADLNGLIIDRAHEGLMHRLSVLDIFARRALGLLGGERCGTRWDARRTSDDEISNRFLALQYSPEAIKSTWELDVLLPLETSSFAGCHPGNKTAYSPENFDEVEKLKSGICSWVENVRQKICRNTKTKQPCSDTH